MAKIDTQTHDIPEIVLKDQEGIECTVTAFVQFDAIDDSDLHRKGGYGPLTRNEVNWETLQVIITYIKHPEEAISIATDECITRQVKAIIREELDCQ